MIVLIHLKIDLSQRGLLPSDARLVKMALLQNKHLTVLKLGYNNLGDVGATILAGGIGVPLQSLDLGFNDVGDEGCAAICRAIPSAGRLHTLYLAGNLIGQEGAMEIADLIRRGSRLQKLYLTGNLLGPEGVTAIADAILEVEERRRGGRDNEMLVIQEQKSEDPEVCPSVEELYLGGVGMGPSGCQAVVRLLQHSHRIRVLSLPNCDITDDLMALLATSIHQNCDHLPLEILQLSFNRITCAGMEQLANAFRGLRMLRELLLDNNEISDRGAQHLALTLLPQAKSLRTLNVGFNQINSAGIKLVMKSVLESSSLLSVSLSGNTVDSSAAKSIAYALAYNVTLTSLSVVHCKIGAEGQRHITAGLVSNSRVALREFSGFAIGPVVVKLGFPPDLEQWSNNQILNFVHLMWHHHRKGLSPAESPNANGTMSEEEKITDPLNFLGSNIAIRSAPLEATIVVEVAKKAFAELEFDGLDGYSEQDGHLNELSYASPIVSDGIIVEAASQPHPHDESIMPAPKSDRKKGTGTPNRVDSFVASPELHKRTVQSDPERKNRIIAWVNANTKELNKAATKPFDSAEMWKLHQHYFTPVVNESGGETVAVPSSNATLPGLTISSVPEVSRTSSSFNPGDSLSVGTNGFSHPTMKSSRPSSNQLSSLPLLKRKVSYRSLGDAVRTESRSSAHLTIEQPVSLLIEGGPGTHSMPPKNKRARRNRTRISFLPRIKKKLDSSLDSCHEKALTTMRQLYFVERAILNGEVNPILPSLDTHPHIHLCGDLADDAETIIVDML